MKQTTLQQIIKTLNTFDPAFKDKTSKGYRIKCWSPLNRKEYKILLNLSKRHNDILEVNNKYIWKTEGPEGKVYEIETFVIRLSKAPSHIVINLDSRIDKDLIKLLNL